MVFAEPSDGHHAEALRIVGETEDAVASILRRDPKTSEERAARPRPYRVRHHVPHPDGEHERRLTVDELIDDIDRQIVALLGG